MIKTNNVKYTVQYAKRFKKEYKKMLKQGKDKTKFWKVVNTIVSGKELAENIKIIS